MKQFLILLFASIASALSTLIITNYHKEPVEFIQGGDIQKAQTIDSLRNYADSLQSELYPCQIELNRYQVAFEIFMRKNPKAAQEYATIISEETE